MTVLVGVLCSDGVVIGADSISTSSAGPHRLIQLPSDDKIIIIENRVIIAGTGQVGLSQRFHAVVSKASTDKVFQKDCVECTKEIAARTVRDFDSTGTGRHPQNGWGFGALMAAPMGGRLELIEFGVTNLQPERKTEKLPFVSMGSGQILADPFLAFVSRALWKNAQPTVKLAMFGVYWALRHSIQIAPGGVGFPIKMAILAREKGQWVARLLDDELNEAGQHIDEIEKRIGDYPAEVIAEAEAVAPPAPPESGKGS